MEKSPYLLHSGQSLTFLIHWEIKVEKKDCLE